MRIHFICIGQRMPTWVEAGFSEYAKRLRQDVRLELIEVPAEKRGKNADVERILQVEGERMQAAIAKHSQVIALDVHGQSWSTAMLAQQLQRWQMNGRDVSLLVGGPEGLAKNCLEIAEEKWSLSNLTFPHPLVRIIVAEQLYRAWSILHQHPYHRE